MVRSHRVISTGSRCPPSAVRSVSELGTFRGRQELFAAQSPQAVEVLREVAVVQSVESSNRIEGVTAAPGTAGGPGCSQDDAVQPP